MKKYALLASFASLTLFACNPPAGDPNSDRNADGIADPTGVRAVDVVNQQAPSSPVGVITGVLADAYTGAPIANQVINISSGRGIQLTATTDENGAFTIPSVAFGYFGFSVVRDNYIPVSTVLEHDPGNDLGEFPTDNYVSNFGTVYLLPSDSSYAVTVVTESGVVVANKEIIVDVLAAFNNWSSTPGQNIGYIGRRTILATTDAQGVATIPGVPDLAKLSRIIGSDYSINVTCGPVDVNGDNVFDFAGVSTQVFSSPAINGRTKFVLVLGAASANNLPTVVASNTSETNGTRPSMIGTSEPIRIVFDQPILPASIVATVTNDFPRLTTPGNRAVDNSSIGYDRENNPEPALNFSTANNTITATLDPSGATMTLTGATAWPAGRILVISFMVSSAKYTGDSGAFLWKRYVYVKPAADALSVEQTLLERPKAAIASGSKYSTLVVGFNQPIIAAPNGIFYCIDADLNNNGSRETNTVLDDRECPAATSTRGLNSADVAHLRRFGALDMGAPAGATRWFAADLIGNVVATPNFDLNGGLAKLPDVYLLINPIVNGTFLDPDGGNPNFAQDGFRRPLATQKIKVVFDVATSTLSQPAVGGAASIANNN